MSENNTIYNQLLKLQVVYEGGPSSQRDVTIRLQRNTFNHFIIKAVESDNHCFNYTATIDNNHFRQLKQEQSLEINYDEFLSQLVDLLNDTQREQMYLRLEADANKCKMVFYEKARLKSLIFLTIDLQVTDKMEIIAEMARNLSHLKETNRNTAYELAMARTQLQDKAALLNTALSANSFMEQHVKRDVQNLENMFCTTLTKVERKISDKLLALSRRHLKLMNDLDIVKAENRLKCESSVRLVNTMQNLRLENERNIKLIDDLKLEVNHLKILRGNAEESCGDVRQTVSRKEREIDELKSQLEELKKDLQDATMIIAQKTKTHDELTKDLMQANTMLVNFNNQYDALSKELDEAQESSKRKDRHVKEQAVRMAKVMEEFEQYKAKYNSEELNKVRQELCFTKQNLHELEKQNKEVVKLNGLLTRKLSSGDAGSHVKNMSHLPPSQRNNY